MLKENEDVFKLTQLLRMFGNCHRDLRRRRKPVATATKMKSPGDALAITRETDLQDFLLFLLRGTFPDVRSEVACPLVGGSQKRVDFLLPRTGIVLETKFVTNARRIVRIFDEIKVDIESYYQLPDCRVMIFFVYDPERVITEPRNWTGDMDGTREIRGQRFDVRILIES